MVMICQCRFIDYNKCTTLMGDVDIGGDSARVGAVGMWNALYFLFTFAVTLKLL